MGSPSGAEVKNKPTMQETQVLSLGQEDPLEKEMATHFSITIPKKGNAKECWNYHTIALISHTSNVMLRILQARLQQCSCLESPRDGGAWSAAIYGVGQSRTWLKRLGGNSSSRLQQYVNKELTDDKTGFRKGRGIRDQIANICWITEKIWESQKNIYFYFIGYAKAFECVDHNKLGNSSRDGNTRPSYCLLWNLFAGQEAAVRTGHWATDKFKIGKEVCQGCVFSSCFFNLYVEYIKWNASLDEACAGIKIARRNISNLRYTDDATLFAES